MRSHVHRHKRQKACRHPYTLHKAKGRKTWVECAVCGKRGVPPSDVGMN